MKNKKLTYVLVAAVLFVWGLIIYRIVAAAGGDDDTATVSALHGVKEAYNDFALPPDTTKLLLNYRDPFGMVKQKDTTEPVKRIHIKQIAPAIPKPAFNWDFIQYGGYMYNASSKKTVTLLTINGQAETLTDGMMKDNVKLIKNMRDSIKISYNGMVKFIHRRPSQ